MKYTEMMSASPESLRTHYAGVRELAFNGARIAQQGRRSADRMLRSMGYLMRQIDMVESVARRRGIALG
jgi:hypothetical protein